MIQPLAIGSGAILGLIFGSFFAALVSRWPQGKSVLRGRSACDACGRTLGVSELVPLLSALASRGKCRTCGARIDPLHWRMELVCAAIGIAAAGLGPYPEALGAMALGWILLTLAVLDARYYWLPDALTLPLIALGLTAGSWVTGVAFADAAIGAVTGYGVLLVIALGYRTWKGRDGLGMGDAKLFGGLGAWFGWQALPFILLGASALGLAWALGMALLKDRRLERQARVPLGTFLCIAALPAVIAGRALLAG